MGSVEELKDAVKDTWERKGVIRQLQAHLRSEVYKAFIDAEDEPRPEPSSENLIINELIREYLIYNGYRDTLSVFIPETGQPIVRPFDRNFLVQHLHVSETARTQQVPLLYCMLAQLQAAGGVMAGKPQLTGVKPDAMQQQQQSSPTMQKQDAAVNSMQKT